MFCKRKAMLLLGVIGLVLTNLSSPVAAQPDKEHQAESLEMMKALQDERKAIQQLTIEKLEKKKQLMEKLDELYDLKMKAMENKDDQALGQFEELQKQMKTIHRQGRSDHKQFREHMRRAKEAAQAEDADLAEEHLKEAAEISKKIVNQMEQQLKIIDEATRELS